VATITTVTVDGSALGAAESEVDPVPGLLYRLEDDRARLWAPGVVVVDYVAGWILPGEANADLPADLQQAVIDLAKGLWFRAGRDPRVKSEEIFEVHRVDYWVGAMGETGDLPPEVASVFDAYRRVQTGYGS
jgi:hypothetical protein